MGYVVFVDTETTGLPPRSTVTSHNFQLWKNCRLVQLAWEIRYEPSNGELALKRNLLVTPVDFEIPDAAVAIHGITTEHAKNNGQSLQSVLEQLFADIASYNVTKIVAHNISFDVNVLLAELYTIAREDLVTILLGMTKFCTMRNGTQPGERWPKLQVLYERLCGPLSDELRNSLHDASVDVHLCSKIYFAMPS